MKPVGPTLGQSKLSEWTKEVEKLKKKYEQRLTNIAKTQIIGAIKIIS